MSRQQRTIKPIPGHHCDWGDVDSEIVQDRDLMVASIVGSMALSGIEMTMAEAWGWFNDVADEPMIDVMREDGAA